MSPYRCPECLSTLTNIAEYFRCNQCAKDYPIISGVPVFSRNRDFYYGEVSKKSMREILARASLSGWRRALFEHADSSGTTYFYDYAASESRAGFKFLLDHFQNGSVLDYGCGMGAITASLARNFATVFATDLTIERVQFTRARVAEEKLRNVTVFCSGDTPHIPLADNTVNVIVINGVLEWIPEFSLGEPRSAQLKFLKELRRVLIDGGLLFVGIENRFGYGNLLGQKEGHTGLRFSALLPRKVATIYSRLVRGKPYRTYTYSRFGYRSLLKAAGFPVADFWGLIQNYRKMEKAVRLSDKTSIRGLFSNRTVAKRVRNIVLRPSMPYIVGSFGIVAGRSHIESYVTKLKKYIVATYLKGEELEISQYLIPGTTATVQVHLSNSKNKYLVKLPLSQSMENLLSAAVNNIEHLETSRGVSLKSFLIPRPIAWDKYQGQTFLLEPTIAGQTLDKLADAPDVKRMFPRLCEYLVLLCNQTREPRGTWGEVLAGCAKRYGEALIEQFGDRGFPHIQLEQTIRAIIEYLKKLPDGNGFHCCIHGDFWHGNIMAAGKELRLTGVLDWDKSEESVPFLDLLHFLVVHQEIVGGMTRGHSVVAMHMALCLESPDTELIRTYAKQIGVPNKIIPTFVLIYWIRQCLVIIRLNGSRSAVENAVCEPLRYFHDFVGRVSMNL